MFLSGRPSFLRMAEPTSPSRRVLVVGSGLAGLSASSELAARNIPVHILERQPKPGGNSIKASSGINGAPTRFQPSGSLDSASVFYEDTLRSASAEVMATMTARRQSLISTLTNSSASAINWLADTQGIDLSRVAQLGGHRYPRTHRGAGTTPPGASIVLTLIKRLTNNSDLVKLETGATVTKVLKSDDGTEVVGVEVTTTNTGTQDGTTGAVNTITGDGSPATTTKTLYGPVIFASGGFAGDSKGVLAQYRPDLAGYPSTNEALPGSQGLLQDIGAQLLDMDLVQIHPTGFIDPKDPHKPTKFLAAEVLRGEGGILLRQGRRFIDELQTRKAVTEAITSAQPNTTDSAGTIGAIKQWDVSLVMDQGAYEAAKAHVDFYLWKGLMRKTTIGELDRPEIALATIKEYAEVVARGRNSQTASNGQTAAAPATSGVQVAIDPQGRTAFGHWTLTDPTPASTVYVGAVTPVVHYTMGGVVFTPEAQVLDFHNNPINGLWAAGEITGGIHGANRLGGSSLLECVVFGRIAGQNAAKYVEERKGR